jgi:hypothetical protein
VLGGGEQHAPDARVRDAGVVVAGECENGYDVDGRQADGVAWAALGHFEQQVVDRCGQGEDLLDLVVAVVVAAPEPLGCGRRRAETSFWCRSRRRRRSR